MFGMTLFCMLIILNSYLSSELIVARGVDGVGCLYNAKVLMRIVKMREVGRYFYVHVDVSFL